MFNNYFRSIEDIILSFSNIQTYTLTTKLYNAKQGFVKGIITFIDQSKLEFIEVKDIELSEKIKYRYHFMDKENNLIFRYDNAKHHIKIKSYPHHKHLRDSILECPEPNIFEILFEIKQGMMHI